MVFSQDYGQRGIYWVIRSGLAHSLSLNTTDSAERRQEIEMLVIRDDS